MTILVTGANGFIGRSVVRALTDRDCTPVVLLHRWSGREELDLLLPPGSIEGCIHLGWYAEPHDYLVNVSGNRASLRASLDLAEALVSRACTSLVVAGTSAEYAESDQTLSEQADVAPWSVYGAAKLSLHHFLRSSLIPDELAVSWARIFNVTGPGEDARRLIPQAAQAMLANRELALSAGTQVRDFLHVDDVAAGLVTALFAARPGAYNIASGRGSTLREVLTELATALRCDPVLLRFGERTRAPFDPDHVVGSADPLRSLGWKPRYDFLQTIASAASHWTTVTAGAGPL